MDHKNSENGSDSIPDLQSNPDEISVKTIHQQNLEKGSSTRVSKTVAYSLLGALSMVFEPQLGFLRYMTYGGKVILRGVCAAVRDPNWYTIEPQVSVVE